MKIDPNAPAYPCDGTLHENGVDPPYFPGLSVRAELAARAMQGLCCGAVGYVGFAETKELTPYANGPCDFGIARRSVALADALIAALNETEARDE